MSTSYAISIQFKMQELLELTPNLNHTAVQTHAHIVQALQMLRISPSLLML